MANPLKLKLKPTSWRSRVVPYSLGVAYGIALRLLFVFGDPFAEAMSLSFFVFTPMAIGFLVIYAQGAAYSGLKRTDFFAPWLAILAFLLTTMVLLLEGVICVLIALPGFLLLASIGGMVAGFIRRRRDFEARTLSVVLLLPLMLSPLEAQLPTVESIKTRSDTIVVDALPEAVWWQIVHVDDIDPSELKFGLTRALGVPRPVRAHMGGEGATAIRYTQWDKGVSFQENIVRFEENQAMTWVFEFPPGSIPTGALDDHVIIGGKYFDLISGGYSLAPLPGNRTELTLSTTYRVSARPRLYVGLWADWVMSDFHAMILDLVRDRAQSPSR